MLTSCNAFTHVVEQDLAGAKTGAAVVILVDWNMVAKQSDRRC
jgi:hypothetical protein